jgi:hypothetical protein
MQGKESAGASTPLATDRMLWMPVAKPYNTATSTIEPAKLRSERRSCFPWHLRSNHQHCFGRKC